MAKSVIFGVKKETLNILHENLTKDDHIVALSPLAGSTSVHAPARTGKHKGYHRVKMEIWIPEDAIKGDNALVELGAAVLLSLPKNRVSDHLVPKEETKGEE